MQPLCRYFSSSWVSCGRQKRSEQGYCKEIKSLDWLNLASLNTFILIKKKPQRVISRVGPLIIQLVSLIPSCFVLFTLTPWDYLCRRTGYFYYFLLSLKDNYVLHFLFISIKNIQGSWCIAWRFQQHPPVWLHCYVTNKNCEFSFLLSRQLYYLS